MACCAVFLKPQFLRSSFKNVGNYQLVLAIDCRDLFKAIDYATVPKSTVIREFLGIHWTLLGLKCIPKETILYVHLPIHTYITGH